MERLKYLSRNGHTLFTFEGYGPYGTAVERRNQALSDAGFSPQYLGHHRGFGSHELPASTSVRRDELTPQLLRRMAEYCAWRAREFRADCAVSRELENSVRTNFEREFGSTLHGLVLPVERPAICDSRMQPHHWLRTANGNYLKLDAAIHGDNHFWPGPCDIAWDLAGIVVEWELDDSARGSLLAQYASFSGDYAMPRIAGYELAYATFRLAWSKMAAVSAPGTDEEPRLIAEYLRYRERVTTLRDLETYPARVVVTPSVPRLQGSDQSYLL